MDKGGNDNSWRTLLEAKDDTIFDLQHSRVHDTIYVTDDEKLMRISEDINDIRDRLLLLNYHVNSYIEEKQKEKK